MARSLLAALVATAVIGLAGPAGAQPGADPGAPPPEPGAPQRDLGPEPPAAPIQMTAEERDLILRGEIPQNLYVAGGLITLFVPFGIGQAVQGRWAERGWIFTAGELGSIGMMIYGIPRCVDEDRGCGFMVAGILGLAGFRIWEMIDAWVAPALHNRNVQEVRQKYGITRDMVPYQARVRPFVAPAGEDGWTGGVTLRF